MILIFFLFWKASIATAGACRGDFILENDLSQIQNCRIIFGSITLQNQQQTALTFDSLESIQNSNLDALIIRHNLLLSNISFPKLTSIEGNVWLFDNPFWSLIQFPQLAQIDGGFFYSPGIPPISILQEKFKDLVNQQQQSQQSLSLQPKVLLPNLESGQNLSLIAVQQVDFSSLTKLTDFSIDSAPSLLSLSMPHLKEMTGSLSLVQLQSLTTTNFPDLFQVQGAIRLSGLQSLKEQQPVFPQLSTVMGTISIDHMTLNGNLFSSQLINVQGSLLLQSTDSQTCQEMSDLKASGVVKGQFDCQTSASSKMFPNLFLLILFIFLSF